MEPSDLVLPRLRTDLLILPGPEAEDGSPSYTMYDPLSGKYRRIGWAEAAILSAWRPGITVGKLREGLLQGTTLRPTDQELALFVREVETHGLAAHSPRRDGARIEAEAKARRIGPFRWLVHHYIYVRVPLIRPDRFLASTLGLARALASGPMLVLYVLAAAAGLFLLAGRWDAYLSTFPRFFDRAGLLAYGATIAGVKLLHEFSHAYVARSHGVRVRSMGLVFIVFWPVPYSDVTDAWRISRKGPRVAIGLAGVAAELALAGIALLAWCLTPPGLAASLFFLVSSTTLVGTLAVNLNPAMRFDGYYVLSDLWGIENLQSRAFALTRWVLRRILVGLDVPPPEPVPRLARMVAFVFYSLYSWVYRVGLYVAIAVLVYREFAKVLGIVLFLVEVGFFLVRPVCEEVVALVRLRKALRPNLCLAVTLALSAAGIFWLAWPSPGSVAMPGILEPVASQTVYAPADGILAGGRFRPGDAIEAGEVLLRVRSRELDARIEILAREIAVQEALLARATADDRERAALPEIVQSLAKAKAGLAAAREEESKRTVRAAFRGVVVEWEEGNLEGQGVARELALGRVADLESWRVLAFVPEEHRDLVEEGATVRFYLAGPEEPLDGTVRGIRATPVERLAFRALASVAGGEVSAREMPDGTLVPVDTWYEVEIALPRDASPPGAGVTGRAVVKTPPRSRLVTFLGRLWNAILRESGF